MNIRRYLFEHNITGKDFAEQIEVARTYLSSLMAGRLKPSKKLIRRIIKESSGKITERDILQSTQVEKQLSHPIKLKGNK